METKENIVTRFEGGRKENRIGDEVFIREDPQWIL